MSGESWAWPTMLFLGAYHGVNPAMGWLFAVALGMQEKSRRAVGRALLPIALGHGLAVGVVVLVVAVLARALVPWRYWKIAVALILVTFGAYRLWRNRHPRWVGMRVGFRDLTIWSFLMASAHGAGFMLLPFLPGMSATNHHSHGAALGGAWIKLLAISLHTGSYLLVTGLVALLVYEKLGLAVLRKAWLNLDLIWAFALIATGAFTLI